jgi:predicted Ser/Thr protein kinase/rubrerythrin
MAGVSEGAALGREFGTVRIKREIGRGAMGVVYLGHDQVLGRDVALKALVHVATAGKEDASSAFLREARAAAAVKHANLTQIHHADVAADGTPFLVMEYVDGPSLAQLLRQCGPMKPSVVVSILAEVCAAVEELHERGIVHRDLKPSNVLVDREEGRVYVTDFGLAVKRSGLSGPADAVVAGTPLYMAPEMFEGQVSARSDIYAIGIMAFEMLCGRVPFSGSLKEVRRQHAEEALPSDELRAKGAPEELIDLIERATHKKAMFRHKTARELSRAVQAVSKAIEGAGTARVELRRLLIRQEDVVGGEAQSMVTPPAAVTTVANSTSYMEALSQIAAVKRERRMRLLEPGAGAGSSAGAGELEYESIARGPLEMNLPCAQCGYNLRSLARDGKCPECGREVQDSLFRERLMFADEQWLRVVKVGVTTIGYGLVAAVLLVVFFQPVVFLVLSIAGRGSGASGGAGALLSDRIIGPLLAAVFLGGVFAATLKEPMRESERQPRVLRWMARLGAIVACLVAAGTALVPEADRDAVMSRLRPVVAAAAFAAMGGVMLYLAWLAERGPELKLARQARRRGWVIVGAGLMVVVLEGMLKLGVFGPASGMVAMGTSIVFMMLIVLSVAMLGLAFRVRRMLREALERLVPAAEAFGEEVGRQ